ncbi:coiled-coil domain-containing protein 136, partial [Ahaetulla prasina]|uniref:coiled-coil domain-containing protein 136 n=1 Tax=Ahaetulla prasina TaxID=499056 RepID=UPI002647F8EA
EEKEEEEQKDKEEEEEEAKEEPKNSSKDDGKTSEEDLEHNLQVQVLQLLDELEETREIVLKHEEDAMELQGLLEDERLASAHQAEIFTKQIQHLQAQMHMRKDELDSLQETKEVEQEQVAQELLEANEEIQNLRLEAEEAAALHENEIASLQEELCRMKAELERVQRIHHEYEMELTALRAEIQMMQDSAPRNRVSASGTPLQEQQLPSASEEIARLQGELDIARVQYTDLKEEFLTLQASNKLMVQQLEKLEAMKYNKYRSRMDDSPSLESISQWPTDRRYSLMKQPANQKGSCVSFWSVEIVGVASDYTEEERMEKVEEESELEGAHQPSEEEKVEKVQTQGNVSQCTLAEIENEDQACYQDVDFKKKPRRRRDSDVRKGVIVTQWNLLETEKEDQSSYPELINKRRSRRRESLKEGREDDFKSWREKARNTEFFLLDPEVNGSSEREGQAQLSLPEMEREDQSSSQDPSNERRPRRERSWKKEICFGQEPDESPGREEQHDRAQHDLRELEERYRHSQSEREQLQEELYLCREEIERLNGNIPTGGRVPDGGMKPFGLFVICAGGLILYSCLKKFNNSGSLT